MRKAAFKKNLPLLIAALLNIAAFFAVFFLMNHVQYLLNSDAKINLIEIVTQNKDVISSKLKVEVNKVDLIASQLSDDLKRTQKVDNDAFEKVFLEYCKRSGSTNLYASFENGTAIFPDSTTLDISGRQYFRLALAGNPNVSDRMISRKDGEDIFVISVPLYSGKEVIGTIQKVYTPEQIYELCSISLFSSQGYMYIINSDGYILLSSQTKEYSDESNNFFRDLYADGNKAQSKQVEQDIKEQRSGFLETTIDGTKIFSAYTPIEDVHDWYLISSVSTSAVSPNANSVIKLFYFILCVIVVVMGSSIIYFLRYKNKQQEHLEQIAFVDTVTSGNTYNKFLIDVRDKIFQYPNKQFHILVFDIDNFKYVNNFYSFEFGDRILYLINEYVNTQLTKNESIARISSDHFVVLLEEAPEQRLNKLFHDMSKFDDVAIYFSAGLYTIINPYESVNLMVDKASTAALSVKGLMYSNIGYYSEKFDEQMMQNELMKRSIEEALLNDEFIPFFQPKVDINTRKLVGAEALARWKTLEGDLVAPFHFIPICEKTGLVTELDMIIFEKTLKFIKKNLDAGIPCVPISVNFSRNHLLDEQFINKIDAKLAEYCVPPHLIELELTESVIFDNSEAITNFTELLHQRGLLISMDDFGSGYSSLNMLKDIPIDILKIDKGFLQETQNSRRRNIIFSSIAQMAKQLNIKIVVEGVENVENVRLMEKCGCYIAQGYFFAKPMDEESFEKIYTDGIVQ